MMLRQYAYTLLKHMDQHMLSSGPSSAPDALTRVLDFLHNQVCPWNC